MKRFLSILYPTLFTTIIFSSAAIAQIQCNQCHGTNTPTDYRPLDSPYRNISTGGFKGNHRTHMGTTTSAANCNPCHGNGVNVSTYLANHRNKHIDMVVNINNSPKLGGATYSKGVFFNQTSTPVTGTCSNVNCHFESTTPSWDSAPFTTSNDCNKCHGAPPNGAAGPGADGSHTKHNVYYSGVTNCQQCHANNTTFAHATSAGKRNLRVSFAVAPNNGVGTYSGPLNDYLPSQTNVFGTCTNLYCHSNGKKTLANFSSNIVPTWGTPLPANCTSCHRADSASGSIMNSGSHDRHVNPAGYNTIACATCHAATVNGMAITNPAKHINRKVDIKFDSLSTAVNGTYGGQLTPYAKDPGTGYGQCNNVYCHSSVQSGSTGTGAPTYSTPTWGTANTGACGSCHAGDNGQHTAGNLMATGSHTTHLSRSYDSLNNTMKCTICHNIGGKTLSVGQGCDNTFCHSAASAKHADGRIDTSINPLFGGSGTYNGSPIPRAGFSTCSNISCHYNTTTPAWGTGSISCFGCHSLAQLMASGSHSKHISSSLIPTMYNYTANRSTAGEYDFGCSTCHPLATSNHMNGSIEVTLKNNEGGAGALRLKNSATAAGINVANSGISGTSKSNVVCSASYCHSNGNPASLIYATTPNWYGGSFSGDRCGNCHGNAPNNIIAGSKSHYNNRFLGYTGNIGGHQIGIHAMKIYSSPGNFAKAGTKGSSSHGNAGTATTISCNICHYDTVTSARNDSNAVCATCHFPGNTVGAQSGNLAAIANRSKHVNGAIDIAFQPISSRSKAQMRSASFSLPLYSSVWKRTAGYKVNGAYDTAKAALNTSSMWNSSTKTCSNVACHNGQSVNWSDNNGATSCISCHSTL